MNRLNDVLTTRGRAFAAAGVTLALAGFGLGFPDLSRVGVLLICLPVVTGLLARRQRPAVRVDRLLTPSRVTVDQPTTVTVTMENVAGRRSPLLVAEERLDGVLGDRPRFLLAPMAPGEQRQVDYEVRSHLRGRHRLGPLVVQLRDPYGLTRRFAQVGGPSEVVVLPRLEHLTGGRPPGNGVGAEGEIPHMVALHGEDDQSIRIYRDGDDLRRIHWPATARTGDLMVRQEDRPARRRAVLLLDARADAHHGSGTSSSFEWAVSAVASMVAHLGAMGYAVHLISPETVHDGQAAASTSLDSALDTLAEAATGPAHEMAELIRAAHPVTATGGLVVAVLADRDEEVFRRVASLRQPGGTALAMVLDTRTFPEGGRRRAPAADTDAYAEVLRLAGWSALTVRAGSSVASVWSAITRRGAPAR